MTESGDVLKVAGEGSAARQPAFNLKAAFVAVHNVFDDGESEARAAALAAAFNVDPVKPFGETRQIGTLNAGAEIAHLDVNQLIDSDAKARGNLFGAVSSAMRWRPVAKWSRRRATADTNFHHGGLAAIFDGIVDQVLHRLENLVAIGANGRRLLVISGEVDNSAA